MLKTKKMRAGKDSSLENTVYLWFILSYSLCELVLRPLIVKRPFILIKNQEVPTILNEHRLDKKIKIIAWEKEHNVHGDSLSSDRIAALALKTVFLDFVNKGLLEIKYITVMKPR